MTEQEKMIRVYWYACECEWWTKFCDDYHKKTALVSESAFKDSWRDGND